MSIDHGVTATDAFGFRAAAPARVDRASAVRAWLWVIAATIFLMVLVGGATRVTESGLSITEWEPLFGAIPPLTAAAWDAKFEAYKQIPQFALHSDMTLAQFKSIFFWEWTHRLIGRALGLVIAVPLAVFWFTGRLTAGLKPRLILLLLLIGLQGAVGWWMVKSGLVARTEVSQYRLATHLLLATFTLGYVVWLARGLSPVVADTPRAAIGRLRNTASLLVGLVFCQIGFGALVAGLRAGLIYNSWPLMGDHLVPPAHELLALQPVWANAFENLTTVQFQHRLLAYVVLACALFHALDCWRVAPGTATAWRSLVLAVLVTAQAAIGIAALLLVVPMDVALTHQALAMIVFASAVLHRRALSQPAAANA